MIPMIKTTADAPPGKFYDELAAAYDGMTGFEQRFPHEHPFLKMLVERYQLKNVT